MLCMYTMCGMYTIIYMCTIYISIYPSVHACVLRVYTMHVCYHVYVYYDTIYIMYTMCNMYIDTMYNTYTIFMCILYIYTEYVSGHYTVHVCCLCVWSMYSMYGMNTIISICQPIRPSIHAYVLCLYTMFAYCVCI